ncbi:MAG: sterol desaturase family protein [Limnohabitans sp.]|nr:sterol desaturase family protein [Limnohabitans sp.]
MLIYELLQYWFHRISREAKGNFGQFLWKIHAIHHLPEKVYLLMHSVVHPLNTIIVMLISQLVFIGLGVNAATLLIINTIVTLQGLLSHFNVEIKVGWLNYVFIGTELHSFHHSNKLDEAQNFGAVLSIWDIVFGTFYYRKNEPPIELGIIQPEKYPDSKDIGKILIFPFVKDKL